MQGFTSWRARGIIAVAVATGAIGGCLLVWLQAPRPQFLNGVSPLLQREEKNSAGADTISYFTLGGDWLKTFDRARRELPSAIEHDTTVAGLQAKVLTVPRVENGRSQLFFPPQEEITFVPRKLALNEQGQVVAVTESRRSWTGIEMREYRKPRALDGLVEWFRRGLKV